MYMGKDGEEGRYCCLLTMYQAIQYLPANPRKTRPILLVAEEVVWGDLWFKGLGEGNRKISG